MMHEEEPRDTFEPAKDKVDNVAEEISCPSPNQVTPQEDSPLYPSVDNTFGKASPNKDTMKVDTVIRDSLGKTPTVGMRTRTHNGAVLSQAPIYLRRTEGMTCTSGP